MGNNKSGIEISLNDLYKILFKRLWLIIICMVIFAAIAYIYSEYYVVPLYRSEVLFLIDPVYNSDYAEQGTEYNKLLVESYSLSLAKQLTNTYFQILQTNNFRNKLSDAYTELYNKPINASFSIVEIPDTELFKMRIISPSIDDAYNTAVLIEKIAPETIAEIIGTEKIRVTDNATKPVYPINNDTRKNVLFAAFFGAVLVYGSSFLIFISDTTIKDEDDLKNHYNIPILGGVLDFDSVNKIMKSYREYK